MTMTEGAVTACAGTPVADDAVMAAASNGVHTPKARPTTTPTPPATDQKRVTGVAPPQRRLLRTPARRGRLPPLRRATLQRPRERDLPACGLHPGCPALLRAPRQGSSERCSVRRPQ